MHRPQAEMQRQPDRHAKKLSFRPHEKLFTVIAAAMLIVGAHCLK
jgi:hypothetical protein